MYRPKGPAPHRPDEDELDETKMKTSPSKDSAIQLVHMSKEKIPNSQITPQIPPYSITTPVHEIHSSNNQNNSHQTFSSTPRSYNTVTPPTHNQTPLHSLTPSSHNLTPHSHDITPPTQNLNQIIENLNQHIEGSDQPPLQQPNTPHKYNTTPLGHSQPNKTPFHINNEPFPQSNNITAPHQFTPIDNNFDFNQYISQPRSNSALSHPISRNFPLSNISIPPCPNNTPIVQPNKTPLHQTNSPPHIHNPNLTPHHNNISPMGAYSQHNLSNDNTLNHSYTHNQTYVPNPHRTPRNDSDMSPLKSYLANQSASDLSDSQLSNSSHHQMEPNMVAAYPNNFTKGKQMPYAHYMSPSHTPRKENTPPYTGAGTPKSHSSTPVAPPLYSDVAPYSVANNLPGGSLLSAYDGSPSQSNHIQQQTSSINGDTLSNQFLGMQTNFQYFSSPYQNHVANRPYLPQPFNHISHHIPLPGTPSQISLDFRQQTKIHEAHYNHTNHPLHHVFPQDHSSTPTDLNTAQRFPLPNSDPSISHLNFNAGGRTNLTPHNQISEINLLQQISHDNHKSTYKINDTDILSHLNTNEDIIKVSLLIL